MARGMYMFCFTTVSSSAVYLLYTKTKCVFNSIMHFLLIGCSIFDGGPSTIKTHIILWCPSSFWSYLHRFETKLLMRGYFFMVHWFCSISWYSVKLLLFLQVYMFFFFTEGVKQKISSGGVLSRKLFEIAYEQYVPFAFFF